MRATNDIMGMDQLRLMKAMAAERGEWKEVERLNKAIRFNVMALQAARKPSRAGSSSRKKARK